MLQIDNVSFAYDNVPVVHDVSLSINEGEIICLLGPSGCGKTTLLRIIAGLATGYVGCVTFDGQDMANVPVQERDFGLMFQDFALFPHMSVAENVAYGLKRKSIPKKDIVSRVNAMLKQVGLAGFDDRDVNMLSGGQKQRVALARSLAPSPRLLMLDEPLGSLDALLRDQLIIELRNIIKSVGLTAIYVTHDHKEAYAIADRIVVMNAGQIEQFDTPFQIFRHPNAVFVAQFLGLSNIFSMDSQPFINQLNNLFDHDVTDSDYLLVHPTGIQLSEHVTDSEITFSSVIESIIFRGVFYEMVVRLDNNTRLTVYSLQNQFDIGYPVNIIIDPTSIVPLDSRRNT